MVVVCVMFQGDNVCYAARVVDLVDSCTDFLTMQVTQHCLERTAGRSDLDFQFGPHCLLSVKVNSNETYSPDSV